MLLKKAAVVVLRHLSTASITASRVRWRRFRTAWRLTHCHSRSTGFS
jgi:hypothetical protein